MAISITDPPFNASTANADNATNIQAAINSVSATEGDGIYIPHGVFKTGPISVVGRKNVHLYSDSGVLQMINSAPLTPGGYQSSLLWVDSGSTAFRCTGVKFDGNGANQSGTIHTGNPHTSGGALLQINADYAIVEDVTLINTQLRGISISGEDDFDRVKYPVISNCKVINSGSEGISTFWGVAPQISGCTASQVGGTFIQVASVTGTTITTASNFTHDRNTMIGFFTKEGTGTDRVNYKYLGSLTKTANVINSNTFTVTSTTLMGGSGSLSYSSTLYLLPSNSAFAEPHGIIHSNSRSGRIEDCYVEYSAMMGIGLISDLGESGIITGCVVKNSGEEGVVLDGCRSGMVTSCSTDGCSVTSNAPDFHIANASPGIDDPRACNLIGNHSRNGLSTGLINCGLLFSSGNILISENHVFRNTTFNWPANSFGITLVGSNATVEGNFVNGVANGIQVIASDSSMVRSNTMTGNSASNSNGVSSNNSSRTIVQGNTIQGYTSAVGVGSQGAYKVIDNFIRTCDYALDDTAPASNESLFSNNHSLVSTSLFRNLVPFVVQDNYYQTLKFARTSYSGTPITFSPPDGGLLRIIADGSLAVPAEKLYRIFRYDPTRWVLYELGGGATNPVVIDIAATINMTTGLVSMSVTGSGGGKALTYNFASYFNTIL